MRKKLKQQGVKKLDSNIESPKDELRNLVAGKTAAGPKSVACLPRKVVDTVLKEEERK